MSAPAASPSRSWSPKRYILLALAGTLVAAVIVVAVSAVFSPAAIEFSVVNATHFYLNEGYVGMHLNFTFAASNPGWRAGVNYRGFLVDLVRHPAGEPPKPFRLSYSKTNGVGTRLPFVQPPRNTTDIMVPLFIGGDDWNKSMDGGSEKTLNVSVQVRATVHFMVGMAYTRAYHIAVLCRLNRTLFSSDNNTVVSYDNHTAGCVSAGLIDPIYS